MSQDGPCRYCGEPTESLAGNPSRWPLVFCWKDEPGVPKFHHVRCVTLKLIEGEDWKARAYEASTLNAKLWRWLENILGAALRYESRHDRDPERPKLWRELKDAISVEPKDEAHT